MLLKKGQESPDVLNLEQVLQGLGFEGFAVDGVFDEKTENVIKYIQKTHGLEPDGMVGVKTLTLLDALYEPLVANFAPKVATPVDVRQDGTIPKGSEELIQTHPLLTRKVLQVIDLAKQEGYNLTVVQGLRTFAEQDKLYAQRPKVTNAKGGQSYHNYGVAADLAFVVDGKISWQDSLYKNLGRWASRVGLEWGGNWRFVDKPHVQLNNLPAIRYLLGTYNTAGGGNIGVRAVWRQYING